MLYVGGVGRVSEGSPFAMAVVIEAVDAPYTRLPMYCTLNVWLAAVSPV